MLYFLRISFRTSLLFYDVKRIKHISFRRIYRNGINLAKGHQKSNLTKITRNHWVSHKSNPIHSEKSRRCHRFTQNLKR